MPSTNFELENKKFREFYDSKIRILEDAKNSFVTLLYALIKHGSAISLSKIEGRVKDKEESIKKFNRKYRVELEAKNQSYSIREHTTDLIGIRIICLYEDDIQKIHDIISAHFDIIDVTNKIELIESTEGSFGYKGLHLDLKINEARKDLPEYILYSAFPFEVQIRTIIQDSWSVLDHKIKYKKSIPNALKRRINTLAALFELADREFRAIRDETELEMRKAEEEPIIEINDEAPINSPIEHNNTTKQNQSPPSSALDAFGFLKIAKHFFPHYEFEPHKVDSFTQEICALEIKITRRSFNYYMKETIGRVKKYQITSEQKLELDQAIPFTIIRHCLYLANPNKFKKLLPNTARISFDLWIKSNPTIS